MKYLGRHRLIGNVIPSFTSSGAGFEFLVTDEAVPLTSDAFKFNAWLNTVLPPSPEFVFISYAAGDAAIADELRADLEKRGLRCFKAEKEIQIETEWQDSGRAALIGSKRILVLPTPRSINGPWVDGNRCRVGPGQSADAGAVAC